MYKYKANLDRIIDGDTIVVDFDLGFGIIMKKQIIRMYGINTPESRTRDLEEKKKGIASKNFLINLIIDKDLEIKTFKDKKGKFGRILGEVYVGGESINLKMVKYGYAKPYFGGKL